MSMQSISVGFGSTKVSAETIYTFHCETVNGNEKYEPTSIEINGNLVADFKESRVRNPIFCYVSSTFQYF